ncbi:carbohydrate kinase [Bifidobacterium aemilianum]|uniref:ADP-dependent (S)-NAD(P)H-hydrate dehydratase n=1 Tax=Bifidobacterium aemilianum TaxID=2493120 RepID=A0A366K8E2_9BIFI|nr:bifunctional ADP-dependent NAD(P)H-hydrate dehydratase/NAD(P)H-hydrate epimerase [Bifidobacterium aemilianum]RBP98005.1 carbohydrate kinase [Bifidobacterium aemilianum]
MAELRDAQGRRALTHKAYDVADVRSMEAPLLAQGIPLMNMAASAVAQVALDALGAAGIEVDEAKLVLLVGGGNNGGDGMYAAAKLARQGSDVTAIAVGRSVHQAAFEAFARQGGKILVLDPQATIPGCQAGFSAGEAGERLETAVDYALSADLIIDAMTGIGAQGPLTGIPATISHALCEQLADRQDNWPSDPSGLPRDLIDGDGTSDEEIPPGLDDGAQGPIVLAVDTPSGLGVDDGSLPGDHLPANLTVMLGALKPCALLPPAAYACGRLVLVDLGFDIDQFAPVVEAMDEDLASSFIRLPKPSDGKYQRGVVGLVTGSEAYPGAAVLSTCAAARTNVGMVRYLGPRRAQDLILGQLPEAVMGKGRVQAWVVGSGVPVHENNSHGRDLQEETISALLAHYELDPLVCEKAEDLGLAERGMEDPEDPDDPAAQQIDPRQMPPICVDAGALDLLPSRVPPQVVITPHAGELARLLSRLGEDLEACEVQADPWHWALRAHELTGATVLLKGGITILVGPDGEGGVRTMVSGRGPAWMATAGSGDVLSGILGAMLAQNEELLESDSSMAVELAAAAAWIHGYAGSLASGSDQQGWQAPDLYGQPLTPLRDRFGYPIVARDLVEEIQTCIWRATTGNSEEADPWAAGSGRFVGQI